MLGYCASANGKTFTRFWPKVSTNRFLVTFEVAACFEQILRFNWKKIFFDFILYFFIHILIICIHLDRWVEVIFSWNLFAFKDNWIFIWVIKRVDYWNITFSLFWKLSIRLWIQGVFYFLIRSLIPFLPFLVYNTILEFLILDRRLYGWCNNFLWESFWQYSRALGTRLHDVYRLYWAFMTHVSKSFERFCYLTFLLNSLLIMLTNDWSNLLVGHLGRILTQTTYL